MRAGLGGAAALHGAAAIRAGGSGDLAWTILTVLLFAGSVLLIVGLFTPAAGALTGVAVLAGIGQSLRGDAADPSMPLACAALVGSATLAVVLLGPGAYAIDARLFGRREIVIQTGTAPRGADDRAPR